MFRDKRIAIVHDSILPCSEARDTLEVLAAMLPDADIFSVSEEALPEPVRARTRAVAWMNRLGARRSLSRGRIALRSLAVRALDLQAYDIVISNCAGFAKGAGQGDQAIHICYCHAPASWSTGWIEDSAERRMMNPFTAGLRRLDMHLAAQPDYFIAVSRAAAAQVKTIYGRNAVVIYPPVDMARYRRRIEPGLHLLAVAPLLAEVRLDILIAACNQMAKELWVVGDGPERKKLEAMAGSSVRFLGSQEEGALPDLIARAHAVFCLGYGEIFDSMPLKANAAGRPAISFLTSHASEIIVDGLTGILSREFSAAGVIDAIERSGRLNWDPEALRAHARSFDVSAFRSQLMTILLDVCGPWAGAASA